MKTMNLIIKQGAARILFAVLIAASLPAFGQQTELTPEDDTQHAVMMTGRATGASVKLRWAPTSASLWRRGNEYGYVVMRHTLMRNNQLVSWEERSVARPIGPEAFLPWRDTARWEQLAQTDQFAPIAAQAILGEDFELEGNSENLSSLANRATEESNRYAFGLFAADHSFNTAIAMGLAWEDKDVKPNETYLYRVYPVSVKTIPIDTLQAENGQAVPVDFYTPIDTGFFSISPKDKFPMPKVQEVEADFGHRMATISWNKELFKQFYVSYRVERSEDGQLWQSLRDIPFVTLERPGVQTDYMFMIDTLPMNNKPYFYRVSGRTVFDDFGPPSDPVQGMGIDPLPEYFPAIISTFQDEKGGFSITWNFNVEDESNIAGFRITRAPTDKGPYEIISGLELLPASSRNYTDPSPLPVNYYRVTATDQYNRDMPSFSALAQLDDETPPAPPVNVRGAILKNGAMVLTWDENKEPDLMGYRVYMGNDRNDEFTQITPRPVSQNYFIDTVSLNTLSKEIYIQVVSLDFRHNTSGFSDMVVVMRPDTIPPAPPAIKDMLADAGGVTITWANSQSRDVVRHDLQRRLKGQEAWTLLNTYTAMRGQVEDISQFTDTTGIVGKDYEYRILAADNSDLESYSPLAIGRRTDTYIRPAVGTVEALPDRRTKMVELRWQYNVRDEVQLFEVYRAKGDEPLSRYFSWTPEEIQAQTATATTGKKAPRSKGFSYAAQDKSVNMNTTYTYSVRAIYRDGGISPLSEPVKVSY
jgi:fibronectin type 3 domain-containing protein